MQIKDSHLLGINIGCVGPPIEERMNLTKKLLRMLIEGFENW